MNLRTLSLFVLFSFFNISTLLSQSAHSEVFRVTIAGNYFRSKMLGSCKAIQVSNQDGNSLYHYKVTKEDVGRDLFIEFNRKPSSKILVTCFVVGNSGGMDAYTYVDVENGSYIDSHRFSYTWRDPYQIEHKGKIIKVEIDNINNFKDFEIPSHSRVEKYSVDDETLTSKYYLSNELGIYFLVKSNQRNYQYYFDENYLDDSKNRELEISEDFEDLYSCKKNQRIHFPTVGRWRGKIKVWFKDYEKPVYIFSNIFTRRVKKDSYWDLHLPDYEVAYSHIEIDPKYGSLAVNKIYEGLPTEITLPKTTINAPDEKKLTSNLKFNTSKNVGYYTATYRFNVGGYYSEIANHQITSMAKWQFIGIDQFVDITFPEIDNNLISEVEGLAELKKPGYLTITAYEVDYENPKDIWTTPHTLLRKHWQMENGIFGVKESFNLRKKD